MRWERQGTPMKKVFMVTFFVLVLTVLLAVGLYSGFHTGFGSTAFSKDQKSVASPTLPKASPDLLTATPVIISTPLPTQVLLATPSLSLEDSMKLTLTPRISTTTLRIYLRGQALGNNPHAFSKVGDCNSLAPYFLSYFDLDPSAYDLGSYGFLQPVIDQFSGSYKRKSLAAADGFNTSAVLSPSRADPNYCDSNESPLVCEYRIHKPSFAIIAIGTDDYLTQDKFETRMRQIIDTTIRLGIVPILMTQMDDANQLNYNTITTQLAEEYDIPLANLALAMQPLPQHGLLDNIHPTGATDAFAFSGYNLSQYGWPVRNLTVLQALYYTWRGLAQP